MQSATLERAPLPSWMGVTGFVDIHCHVLHGLDDGPRNHEQAQSLIDAAHRSGIAAIIATPHFSDRYPLDAEQRDLTVAAMDQADASSLLVFPGCELELSDERLTQFFNAPRTFTLNHSRYALVELPHSAGGASLASIAERFCSQGWTPILAHPERYPFLPPDSSAIAAWIAAGGLMQATAASFTGRMGRRAEKVAFELLARDQIHFVASDAHDAFKRGPDMRPAFRLVAEATNVAVAGRLFTHNPLAVIRDEPLLG